MHITFGTYSAQRAIRINEKKSNMHKKMNIYG